MKWWHVPENQLQDCFFLWVSLLSKNLGGKCLIDKNGTEKAEQSQRAGEGEREAFPSILICESHGKRGEKLELAVRTCTNPCLQPGLPLWFSDLCTLTFLLLLALICSIRQSDCVTSIKTGSQVHSCDFLKAPDVYAMLLNFMVNVSFHQLKCPHDMT